MNNKITTTIRKFNMLSVGDTVLLAVSGGADSMLMLDYFVKNKEMLGVELKVAHIEHGIRGKASLDDADFVRSCCEKCGIEFHILSIDAVNEAKLAGQSVEEYSRNRRYEFFDTIECDKIATAHNLTDNIETIIYRLARGTGIKGVCGIPAVRGKIIRPLIELASGEIRAYCDNNSIDYRIDSTNSDNKYSRNLIRNELLPLLSKLNPEYENQFSSFVSDINEDCDFIEASVEEAYRKCCEDNRLLVNVLGKYPLSIKKRVVLRYFFDNCISLDRLHLNQVVQLIDSCGRVQLCGDIYAVSNKSFLRIADYSPQKNDFSFVSEILNINEFHSKDIDFYCDCDKIIGSVMVRGRKAGDRIKPARRNCEKSLKKLFNELEIPVEKRDSIPIICDDNGVIGVCGYCVDERVRLDDKTVNVITIKFPSED